jgi:hypothetical protein
MAAAAANAETNCRREFIGMASAKGIERLDAHFRASTLVKCV